VLRQAGEAAVPFLAEALRDDHLDVRMVAADALKRSGTRAAKAALADGGVFTS
jgi:HEAT repeat protein